MIGGNSGDPQDGQTQRHIDHAVAAGDGGFGPGGQIVDPFGLPLADMGYAAIGQDEQPRRGRGRYD